MANKTIKIDATWKKAMLALAAAACLFAGWIVSKWGMANSAAIRTDDADVALYLTELAPDDPQTHYSASVLLEKRFDLADFDRSLTELEKATGLSPNNYLLWLDLGRARERSGDSEGAERALRRAVDLAPNYARVQWALGNALLRQGRREEAFAEIRKAVEGDSTFASPAAVTAWQFFGGDVEAIRRSIGGSSLLEGTLAVLLVKEQSVDEGMAIWNSLPPQVKLAELNEIGKGLYSKLLEARRFRYAMRVRADIDTNISGEPGTISNGGFESAVKPEGAGPFEWQIAGGLQPQIVLSTGQKHGGNNSLLLVFSTGDGKDFRSVSKLVAVEPDRDYEVEIFYRSDLKTAAVFKWEVADAAEGKVISTSDPIAIKSEWTPLRIRFRAPVSIDGVILRFVREGCGQVCAVNGNLWFDDVTLRPVGQ